MNIWQIIIEIILGLGAGTVVSGGVVAFISIIGVIPNIAYRTKTAYAIKKYETAIILGAIVGSVLYILEGIFEIPTIPYVTHGIMAFVFLCFGLFVGALIIALAEVLDVFPIIDRRIKIKKGITIIVISLALGKLVGSLIYWIRPEFYDIISPFGSTPQSIEEFMNFMTTFK